MRFLEHYPRMLDKLEQLIAMCPQEKFVGSMRLTNFIDDSQGPVFLKQAQLTEEHIINFAAFAAKQQTRPGLEAP